MTKFITVLDSDLGGSDWLAVQESDNLETLKANEQYAAGTNSIFKRSGADQIILTKIVRERTTRVPANATVIELRNGGIRGFLNSIGRGFKNLFN